MPSVNKVILLGNCGRDAEVRYSPSGMAIANVSIATTSRRKDKQSGETVEDTQWHRVTFYDRLAEIAGEYLRKGKPVYLEGRLKYGKYTDKDGIERNTTDVVAESMQLLGSRDDGGEQRTPAPPPRNSAPAPARGNAYQDVKGARAPATPPPPAQRSNTGFDDMDDDIPF